MKAIFAAAVSAVVLAASPAMSESWKDQYKTIKFGILSGENEKDRIARYTPFEKYLENELGVEVEIFTAGSYDGVIQAIAADQIEFAFLARPRMRQPIPKPIAVLFRWSPGFRKMAPQATTQWSRFAATAALKRWKT